jgi:hypothetical protein
MKEHDKLTGKIVDIHERGDDWLIGTLLQSDKTPQLFRYHGIENEVMPEVGDDIDEYGNWLISPTMGTMFVIGMTYSGGIT